MEADLGDDVVTDDDIAALNRASVDRSAVLARIAGAVLVVIGAVAVLGWLWTSVRQQQQFDRDFFAGQDIGAKERVDLFASNLSSLVLAAGVIGLGAAMRLVADYAQTREGSSITGFQVGDRFTGGDEEPDELELLPDA